MKKLMHFSREIEDFIETHFFKLYVILRSHVLGGVRPGTFWPNHTTATPTVDALMKDIGR